MLLFSGPQFSLEGELLRLSDVCMLSERIIPVLVALISLSQILINYKQSHVKSLVTVSVLSDCILINLIEICLTSNAL